MAYLLAPPALDMLPYLAAYPTQLSSPSNGINNIIPHFIRQTHTFSILGKRLNLFISCSFSPPITTPETVIISTKFPHLCVMSSNSLKLINSFHSLVISMICPAASFYESSAEHISTMAWRRRSGETFLVLVEICSMARQSRAWQAGAVVASPKILRFARLPLRKSSLSKQGKSSWITAIVMSIFTARGSGIAADSVPPSTHMKQCLEFRKNTYQTMHAMYPNWICLVDHYYIL